MYLDQNNLTPTVSPRAINDTSALMVTLKQLNTDTTISYLLYNDQPPGSSGLELDATVYAHAKGVLAYTSTQGIYIIHSTPLFPFLDSNGNIVLDINDSQIIYGQNYMCIQLTTLQVFQIAGLMTLNLPQVYHYRININNSNITTLASNQKSSLPNSQLSMTFTNGNLPFTYLAKTAASNLDLWEDVVSLKFKAGFQSETWGRPYQSSYCTPSYVWTELNILTIALGSYAWKNTQDHSKWGISLSGSIVCYADMNRMDSQKSRGGGAMCINWTSLYDAHKKIITSQDVCPTSFSAN